MTEDSAAWVEVERFHRREILLLQDRRYRDWLALMHPAIEYRVPVTTLTLRGLQAVEDGLGYYDEDLALLEARVAKLESKMSWVEQPPSRLRYFVQTVDVARESDGAIHARSNILLHQYRSNMEQSFSGDRTDTLVETAEGLRLRKRLVVLDRQILGNQGLSVFF